MVKVLLGCSTVKKYKRKNINLENGRCVSGSQSGDKSEMINLFELRKVAGRLVAWAEQLDFIRCYCRTHRVPTYPWYFPPPSPSSWPVSDYYYKCLIYHIQA